MYVYLYVTSTIHSITLSQCDGEFDRFANIGIYSIRISDTKQKTLFQEHTVIDETLFADWSNVTAHIGTLLGMTVGLKKIDEICKTDEPASKIVVLTDIKSVVKALQNCDATKSTAMDDFWNNQYRHEAPDVLLKYLDTRGALLTKGVAIDHITQITPAVAKKTVPSQPSLLPEQTQVLKQLRATQTDLFKKMEKLLCTQC